MKKLPLTKKKKISWCQIGEEERGTNVDIKAVSGGRRAVKLMGFMTENHGVSGKYEERWSDDSKCVGARWGVQVVARGLETVPTEDSVSRWALLGASLKLKTIDVLWPLHLSSCVLSSHQAKLTYALTISHSRNVCSLREASVLILFTTISNYWCSIS